jgi:nucleoside-diphosphate-sugar epimerase
VSENVLFTGGFGLVGSQTVRRLAADGHRVVATDLGTRAQRRAARALPAGAEARRADLTDPAAVERLVAETAPTVIIHLAGVIPAVIYRNAALARRVNVDATVSLLRAAESCPRRPRFIQASSNAVHGARNPHRHHELLRAGTPIARQLLSRRAAYRNAPGRYADPWGAIRAELGEPRPDSVLVDRRA